ncbi:hypothetical protein [Streptomyces sp. NPDC088812]|uniref:hypothetical protein n=1 Tax=Streptomyces sp. NPDC088812 TaxID=3365905 RepID=UPI0038297E3D
MAGWRPALAVVAGTLLLSGCTDGTDDGRTARGTPSASAGGKRSPSPSSPTASPSSSSGAYTLAENRAPRTRAEAVAFVRSLVVRPDYFGAGYRRGEPYESDPARWAVLGEDCVWRREPLPRTVLASLTRRFELPEEKGKDAVYVALTVTVHTSTVQARRDMAGSVEEALRCPEQRLSATERVRGLSSQAQTATEQESPTTEDDLQEAGEYVVDGEEPRPFDWSKFRLGPVTVAATVRHGAGRVEYDIAVDALKGVGFVAAEIDRRDESGDTGTKDEPTGTGGAGGGGSTGGAGTTGGTESTGGAEGGR